MSLRRRLILLVFALAPLMVSAQTSEPIERILDLLPGDDGDRQLLLERLTDLEAHPLDLNAATAEDLSRLPFLDDFSIRNILLLRSQQGGFRTVYDIKQALPQMPAAQLALLEPFIRVGESPYTRPTTIRHDLLVGSTVTLRQRSAPSLAFRYEGKRGRELAWHLAMQKDRGEQWLPLRQGAFDYLSGSLFWAKDRYRLALGDYRLTTAQGLLLGMSYSYFSALEYGGSGSGTWLRQLRPHRSFREVGFLRGAAFHWLPERPFSALLFAGYEPIDARIEGDSIRTLYQTGLCRTESERRYRHSARREMVGTYLSYRVVDFELALTTLLHRYRSRAGTVLQPHRLYPRRALLSQTSLSFNYSGQQWQASAEAVLGRKERSALQGALTFRDESLGVLTLQGRYYGVQYISPYGAPDSYYSSRRGERGLRLMWQGEVAYWLTGALFVDRFRRLEPYAKPGHVLSARLVYAGTPWWVTATARYVAPGDRPRRFTARLVADRTLSPAWTMRGGVQLGKASTTPTGYSLFGHVRYQSSDIVAEVGAQYYHLAGSMVRARLPYMPYLYTPLMLRGKGWHYYGSVRYQITPQAQLSARLYPSFVDLAFTLKLP